MALSDRIAQLEQLERRQSSGDNTDYSSVLSPPVQEKKSDAASRTCSPSMPACSTDTHENGTTESVSSVLSPSRKPRSRKVKVPHSYFLSNRKSERCKSWDLGELDGLALLIEDRRFIEARTFERHDKVFLLRRYREVWLAAAASQPLTHKKDNAGRRAANMWLRDRTSKTSDDPATDQCSNMYEPARPLW